MLTEQEVKNLEQQAELTRRRNAALDSMKSDQTSRLQRRYNDARQASDNAAHARFMERRRQFAERNPYTVTPDERRRFQTLSDRADLREHEMAMLTRRNQGALDIAQVNAEGALANTRQLGANQLAVENLKQDGLLSMESERNHLKRAELNQARELELERIRTADALERRKLKSQRDLATIEGDYSVKRQAEANKGIITRELARQQESEAKIAAQLQKAIIARDGKVLTEKAKSNTRVIAAAISAGGQNGTPAAETLKQLEETYKNDPEMLDVIDATRQQMNAGISNVPREGETRQIEGGKTAVFRNGEWVLA